MPESWKHWEGRVVDGRFPLRQYLGGSDHSAVFLTNRGQESDRAAIKLFSVSSDQRTNQLRRWEAAKKLAHPHLLGFFQAGTCQLDGNELLYAVVEYAEENLSQILPDRPLTSAECLDMLPPVLEALSYIHSQNLVHSRLKPANILASGDRLKLASDGLRAVGETGADVSPSIYVPPEIASGEPWSSASEVWSLGITLVEALTQGAPDDAGNGDLIVPKAIPAPFLEIAENCLVRDPRGRWTLAEITARLHPSPAASRKEAITPRTVSPRRNVLAPMAAAALLVLVIVVGARWINHHSPPQPSASAAASPQSPSGARSPAISPPANPGAVSEQPLPDVPAAARNTIQGKVRVKVKVSVDSSGNVDGSRLASAGPSKYFANLALRTAQGWKFVPPQKDGQNVTSEWILAFEFGRAGTNVRPVQVAP